ncbi:MAG: hypothetical protein ACT4OF_00425 [Caulobacteraceae bacterium]
MRALLLLLIVGVAAYFTVPTRAAHEAAARVYLEGMAQAPPEAQQQGGLSLDSVVDYVTGMLAGQGRYENFYVISKYTVDMPGASYLECYGAFTVVRCSDASVPEAS